MSQGGCSPLELLLRDAFASGTLEEFARALTKNALTPQDTETSLIFHDRAGSALQDEQTTSAF